MIRLLAVGGILPRYAKCGGGAKPWLKAAFMLLFFSAAALFADPHDISPPLSEAASPALPDFPKIFSSDWRRALAYVRREGPAIVRELSVCGAEPSEALSVVFPELVRYNILRDHMEIAALLFLYVDKGTRYADFSVGVFQMKPSFAERVEMALLAVADPPEALERYFDFPAANTKEARRERLKRLSDPIWHARYLAAFIAIVYDRHGDYLADMEGADRVAFLSTAYNAGFYKDLEYLESVSAKAFFPDKTFWNGPLYRYAEVARYFYEHELPVLGLGP